jgi:hypothetical protein
MNEMVKQNKLVDMSSSVSGVITPVMVFFGCVLAIGQPYGLLTGQMAANTAKWGMVICLAVILLSTAWLWKSQVNAPHTVARQLSSQFSSDFEEEDETLESPQKAESGIYENQKDLKNPFLKPFKHLAKELGKSAKGLGKGVASIGKEIGKGAKGLGTEIGKGVDQLGKELGNGVGKFSELSTHTHKHDTHDSEDIINAAVADKLLRHDGFLPNTSALARATAGKGMQGLGTELNKGPKGLGHSVDQQGFDSGENSLKESVSGGSEDTITAAVADKLLMYDGPLPNTSALARATATGKTPVKKIPEAEQAADSFTKELKVGQIHTDKASSQGTECGCEGTGALPAATESMFPDSATGEMSATSSGGSIPQNASHREMHQMLMHRPGGSKQSRPTLANATSVECVDEFALPDFSQFLDSPVSSCGDGSR